MIGFVPVEACNAALIAQMADPAIRIVALTVAEGGYYMDPVTKGSDTDHPDIVHDATHPQIPRSFGIEDAAPVTHENFRQSVIEDTFCAGRPARKKLGATLTDNVHA